ncbi:LysR family transcriptional regulator [Rhodopseudomonas boonkerdii]|uniref:LysR family transcriptional regulator n=1 Tax=Rhodopseudomonas boonkerdii TaxID=475937 RepID=UPI001E59DF67|nr:LysR family transcriptional regulator [Rhodopseudomonas boonkerdii]UGV25571.1 LysR family transcriptional regulator [Rhodopseudomonas boonkerdii]
MQGLDWDLLRTFSVIAGEASLTRAGALLKVSAQTVSRRLAELEAITGVRLIARSLEGYSLTPAGERLSVQLENMRLEAVRIESVIAEIREQPVGNVRLSITEVLSGPWLMGAIAEFNRRYPDIMLEIRVDGWPASVRRREADIVLRLFGPGNENLVGRKVGRLGVGVFASKAYARAHGLPKTREEWEGYSSIGLVGESPLMEWFDSVSRHSRRVLQCSSHTDLMAAARAGLGFAPLMCISGDADKSLVRVLPEKLRSSTEIWMLSHPDLVDAPQIRAVLDFIAEQAKKDQTRLLG